MRCRQQGPLTLMPYDVPFANLELRLNCRFQKGPTIPVHPKTSFLKLNRKKQLSEATHRSNYKLLKPGKIAKF